MDIKRALVVAYIFPPTGGAGVQRVTKFVKYLPKHGWNTSVLTVANPSVPLFDESLSADIPADTVICRARTWEPGYATKLAVASEHSRNGKAAGIARRLVMATTKRAGKLVFQPDPQILWVPEAIREGKRLLRRLGHDVILATAPPFSSFLVATALSKFSGLPLLLDYRDEWDLTNVYFEHQRPDRWSRFVQSRMQRHVVRSARALIATTRSSAQSLEKVRLATRSKAEVTWIYNGYDPADFAVTEGNQWSRSERFRLIYLGTLWTLTSAAPLVEAVRRMAQRMPELAAHLELVFVGRRIGFQAKILEPLKELPCKVTESAYVPHTEAVRLLKSADALCALLSDLPGAGRVVPAKVFEYMAVRRPIVVIAPKGELWELVESHPSALCFEPTDVDGITRYLEQRISAHQRGVDDNLTEQPTHRFDRECQAGQLAHLLDMYRCRSASGIGCKPK